MDLDALRIEVLSSHLAFTKVFFELKTGRSFDTPQPIGRQSHYEIISHELEQCFDLSTNRLIINVPPGHAKSTLLIYFIAWALAQYPDSNFIYVSYSAHLAEKHTATIKEIIEMPLYRRLFGVELRKDSQAKGNFKTTAGGSIKAFGSSGSITGQDGGLPNLDRFSGAVIMDDMHKPDDVFSDTIRQGVIDNYSNTIKPRPRGPNVPLIFIGQRLHEDDLAQYLIDGRDGYDWRKVILKSIDEAGNALCPNINSLQMLRIEQETNPYVFSSQYQQTPSPAGGGIFKPEWFHIIDEEPRIIETFLTIDTAESAKEWADATSFSFWGIYKINHKGIDTDQYALHWLMAQELRIEPKDLESEFFSFYAQCMRYKVKPKCVAIEKKSTGVTLASTLKSVQGLRTIDIERTKASGSKTARYFEMQKYIASRHISLPAEAKHTKTVLEHMRKITANDTHKNDDLCDNCYDAIKLALIDKTLINPNATTYTDLGKSVYETQNQVDRLRKIAYNR